MPRCGFIIVCVEDNWGAQSGWVSLCSLPTRYSVVQQNTQYCTVQYDCTVVVQATSLVVFVLCIVHGDRAAHVRCIVKRPVLVYLQLNMHRR